ncbi:L-protein-like protein [Ranavirus ambystoma1]|uniref:L-protein-like protein n=1 Tax=Ranavirus ambystoma1 TaxID=265294 RepID=A0A0U2RSL5_9VIRU|nr:L-protein-like protein [Ambystoma tigrinum virus]ALN36661.1 L-protein-like protein [Ambystoma tigrinum virus]ALN36765.1 L-protein-like protein [Ambystoma tigrinum virus]ALN36867.1 L-protein-like protein [Ambystoma tigrinum virus]ALN36966.1 L-protein-like protein [Ambystoma tigrinum virus]
MSVGHLRKRRYAKVGDIHDMGPILGGVHDVSSPPPNVHYQQQQDDPNDPGCMIHYPGEGWFSNMSTAEKLMLGAVIVAAVVVGVRMFISSGNSRATSSFSTTPYFMG